MYLKFNSIVLFHTKRRHRKSQCHGKRLLPAFRLFCIQQTVAKTNLQVAVLTFLEES